MRRPRRREQVTGWRWLVIALGMSGVLLILQPWAKGPFSMLAAAAAALFFQDKRYLDEFESGKFEFAAGASAVAITAGASASVGTDRASSEASGGLRDATTNGDYQTGMAVFTIAKGGLMFAADIAGEKFVYTERPAK
jgi:drug/metabolite transporter (DMT)-like permease